MTILGVVETYFVINYYLGPLNDTVCQMGRVMRWETWSTTCGALRSTGCWLSFGCHDSHLAIGLCDCVSGCRNELVAVFGSQSWGWRTTPPHPLPPHPGTVLSLLSSVKGENMTLHFEAIGYSSKTYFNLGLWGVGNWKGRTGILCGRGLVLVAVSSELGLRPYTSWEALMYSGMLGNGAELAC